MENSTEQTTGTDQNNDLLSRLSAATEKKEPGTKTSQAATSFWDYSDDDFETPAAPSAEKPNDSETEKPADKKQDSATPKISDKLKLGSAKTATGMVDLTCKSLITPIHAFKTRKKIEKAFDEKQLELIESKLQDAELSELDAKEKRLKSLFDKIMAKHEKKMAAVPMTEAEKKDVTDAFYNYFDYTNQTMSPGWYIGLTLTDVIGKRVIDAITD